MSSEEFQTAGDSTTADEPPPGELGGKLKGLSLPKQVLALALWPFLQNLMGVGVGSGLISGVMIWLIVPYMGQLFGMSDLAQQYVTDYMRMGALLAPFSGILFVSSSCLRAYGDTMRPFWAMFLVS